MKNRTLYILFIAVTALFSLQSCSLEELDAPVSGGAGQTYIEFIARATSYNKTDVATKSAVSDIESAVYNAFLLVFDGTGTRILCKEITDPTTTPSTSIPIDKSLSNVTACFLINVPSSFAHGIKGLTKPTDDQTALDNEYINTAVLDGITYGSGSNLGLPYIDLDGTGPNSAVACIPMFGMNMVNLAGGTSSAQITVKRLFAKVTVDLKLDMNLNNWNNLIQTYTYLQLNYYELRNMPNRVRLVESTGQSAWVTDPNSDSFVTSEISSGIVNIQIYNQSSSTSNNKTCIFEFYVPEYYLNRASEWTNDEKSKPNNKPANAKAIHLFLDATYSQYSLTTTDLQYEIYLGRDAISDFSLARNVNYINTLTVKGIDQNDVDHRVTTTVINNPVAKEGKSANCYVIGKVGPYYFPAYKGAYNDLTKAVLCSNPNAKLVELVNDNEDNIVLDSLVYDVDKNIVSFKVSKIADGNVVIALVDDKNTDSTEDDEIEWSWHLWCNTTSTINVLGWGDLKTHTYPSTAVMMDRNLGALNATYTLLNQNDVIGAYYKYGCKEPYVDGAYRGGGSIKDSDGNAVMGVWGSDSKSPTDPCPPGYRIPQSRVFGGNATKEDAPALGAFRFWNNNSSLNTADDTYFPYSGYIDTQDTKQQGTGVDSEYTQLSAGNLQISDIRTNEEQIGDIQYNEVAYVIRYEEAELGYDEYRYSEFIYQTKLKTNKIGSYLTTNNTGVQYYVKESNWTDYQIVQCKREKRQVKRKVQRFYEYKNVAGRWEWPRYEWVLSQDWREIVSPQTSDWVDDGIMTTQSSTYISNNTLGSINNSDWLGTLRSNQSSRKFEDLVTRTSMSTHFGYQVRCVSETSPVQ